MVPEIQLNGVHQLYSVTFGTYDRPIRTPVANMRPAKTRARTVSGPKNFSARNSNHSIDTPTTRTIRAGSFACSSMLAEVVRRLVNRLDTSLPYLKRQAVEALSKPYTTNDEALKTISSSLGDYYRTNYAQVHSEKRFRNDCNICHTVLYDSARAPEQNPRGGPFKHPVDLGGLATRKCESCHQANKPFQHPLNLGDISMFQCAECHPRE